MSFFSHKKSTDEVVAVIDVGSAQVNGALVQIDQPVTDLAPVNILDSVKENFTQTIERRPEELKNFLNLAIQALSRSLIELKKSSSERPQRLFCFLSSPFFLSQTKIVSWRGDQPVKITLDLIQKLVSAEAQKFIAGNSRLYPEIIDDSSVIIEEKIMEIKLDGYQTKNPVNKTASTLEFSLYLSLGSLEVLQKLQAAVLAVWPRTNLYFHTFSYAAFNVFRDLANQPDDFILIDPGGEITDVLAIVDGVLAEHVTFPIGKNFLLRFVADQTGSAPDEVFSSLKLLKENNANILLKNRIEPALAAAKGKWIAALKQALSVVSESSFLPEKFYLIGDDLTDEIFADFIKTSEMTDVSLSTNNFSVDFIEGKILPAAGGQQVTNTFLLMEVLFCDKIYHS